MVRVFVGGRVQVGDSEDGEFADGVREGGFCADGGEEGIPFLRRCQFLGPGLLEV